MASDSTPIILELGQALADSGILTEAQWAQAVARAGGDHAELSVVLDILTRTPAAWAPHEGVGGVRTMALSKHQLKQIERGLKENALPKLGRALRWNNYFILDPIGKGGMGTVYKGWDVEAKHYVAIKRTHRDSAEVRKRLKREAKLQLALDHANIAKLFSLEKYGSTDLLVMEYLPGNTLSEVVQKRGREKPLPWQFIAEIAAAILDALGHAHGNNPRGVTVVHRDIKPGNIMLMRVKTGSGEKYVPKLLDMGLAKSLGGNDAAPGPDMVSVDEQLTRQFQILGTPEYMAPEQWEGGLAALPESDVYCLGGTLYYALVGEAPFSGVNKGNKMTYFAEMCHKHSADPRPSVRVKRPDIPIEVDRLLQQMMAIAPSHRGTTSRLRDQFQALLEAATPSAGFAARSVGGPKSTAPTARSSQPEPAVAYQFADPEPVAPVRPATPAPPKPKLRAIDDLDDSNLEVVSMAAPATRGKTPRRQEKMEDTEDTDEEDDDGVSQPISRRISQNAVSNRAQRLLDPSREGEQQRQAFGEAIVAWLCGLIRPDQQPISVALVVLILAALGWFVGWGLAAFATVILMMAVGFAYTARNRPSDE
ncbi:MAG: serine/threonine protein kinase [Bacteroidales bacterium]|nr:serine/threonine protein kinase [Bacteroidales bacterium]